MITPTENVVAELAITPDELRLIAEYACWDKFEDRYTSDPKKHPAWRAAALIESQRATIERVERERDEAYDAPPGAIDALQAALQGAEARVTALEAEKAGAVKLADGYGIVLMMIAAGCSNPQRFAKRMLAEYAPEANALKREQNDA